MLFKCYGLKNKTDKEGTLYDKNGFCCDGCLKTIYLTESGDNQFNYHCIPCKYDLCRDCIENNYADASEANKNPSNNILKKNKKKKYNSFKHKKSLKSYKNWPALENKGFKHFYNLDKKLSVLENSMIGASTKFFNKSSSGKFLFLCQGGANIKAGPGAYFKWDYQ